MRCVIMQPTYLPWAGYFNLIANADFFVFLDDVQFEKQSWQNRNRILLNGQPHWLTVPVKRKHLSDCINQILVDDQRDWRHKHIELLRHTYSRHPYVIDMLDSVRDTLDPSITYLSELNIRFIRRIARTLDLSSRFFLSSELGITGARSKRLLNICEYFDCDTYLSPLGAAAYLAEDAVFEHSKVSLEFQDFSTQPYIQRESQPFVSHLSIVDVLANLGKSATRNYVMNVPHPE